MQKFVMALLLMLLLLPLAGCGEAEEDTATVSEPASAVVSGEVFYRERIAAPGNARLEVVLEDISVADAPAVRVGEMVLENAGQPPYEYSIDYVVDEINPQHRYRVAARLYEDDTLLFVSDHIHQVITHDFPSMVNIRMKQVPVRTVDTSESVDTSEPGGSEVLDSSSKGAIELPATFKGTLPIGEQGYDVQLTLLENEVFFVRETSLREGGTTSDDIGRFFLDGEVLRLEGGKEAPQHLRVVSDTTLAWVTPAEQANVVQNPFVRDTRFDLLRQAEVEWFAPSVPVRASYRYFAGVGRLEECRSGLVMPVAQEGANGELEAAYLAAIETPNEPLFVNLVGRIEQRLLGEGEGEHRGSVFIVEAFQGLSGDACPGAAQDVVN